MTTCYTRERGYNIMKEEIAGRKPGYGFFNRLTYGIGEIFGGGCFVIINAFFIVFLTDAMLWWERSGMPSRILSWAT